MFLRKTASVLAFFFAMAGIAWGNSPLNELVGDPIAEKPEFTIQKSDAKCIVVDYTFPGVTTKSVKRGDLTFDLLEVEGLGCTGTVGAPELPVFSKLFAIPDRAKVIIKSFIPVYKTYSGIYPYPHQDLEYDNPTASEDLILDDKYYHQGEFFPDKWVTLSSPAIFRDYRVIPVNICPVRVNPVTGEAMVLTSLHLELEFTDGASENTKTHHFNQTVVPFNKMYPEFIANLDWVNSNGVEVKGSILIVYPNVGNTATILQPLIDWKKRSGYATTAISVNNGATTNTVQNIIQSAYNTLNPPLEHVILVGDAAGTLDIDCYYFQNGGGNGNTDHYYAMLEGGDLLPEVSVGRISVDATTTLQTAVNKILYYEKNPTLTTTAWYKRGAVCAGSSSSGISTIQTSKTIKAYMLEADFTQVDTLWYTMGGSVPTFLTNECNNGVTALNYRGYIGVNGFTTSSVAALTNTYKLPYAVIITCSTGDYGSGYAISESWLRAGNPSNPTGGIGGIGLGTAYTQTRFNNCMAAGLWCGWSHEGITQLGPMLMRGKLEIFNAYQLDPGWMSAYTHWTNLMGDPSVDMWSDVPKISEVTYPDTIAVGTSSFTVTVTDTASEPLPDRYVTLWKGTETYLGGRTDENGVFTTPINVPTAGNMYVTVTYHNDYPHLGTVPVVSSEVNPSFNALTVDDDNTAPSVGNGDGYANPGETLELDVQLKNFGTATTATAISATLSTPDTGATVITGTQSYANLAPNATAYGNGKFVVDLGSYFPQGYQIPFTLTVNSAQGTFASAFNLQVRSGESYVQSASFATGILDPGETDNLTVSIRNSGQMNLTAVTAAISSTDDQITIIDNQGSFGNINAGQLASNAGNTFSIHADQFATFGHHAEIVMHIASSNGFEQDLFFNITIGQISSTDPIGPDAYGYYCVDNTDFQYVGRPTYNWVEISGLGTQLNLPDNGNEQDASVRVTMPFNFTFYGETTQYLTVCSNGWLAFGSLATHTDFRNYPMPSAMGPVGPMLCPYWDDLKMGSGHVYVWNDATNHRYIIEYDNVQTYSSSMTQKFQVILYDPAFYPTPTGDGEVICNYMTVNPVQGPTSTDNPYFTTGIENHDHNIGIQYAYWNVYTPGAATLTTGRAIKFTTIEPFRSAMPQTIEVTLLPVNPPINIPAIGGTFQYTITGTNTGTTATIFDLWIMVTLPTGISMGPVLNVQNLDFNPGQTVTKTRSQSVPGIAAPGTYNYRAYVGEYPSVMWDSSSFTFTKLGIDAGAGGEWSIAIWDDSQLLTANSQLPTEYELASAKPNPFNPSTDISYALPEAGKVTLAVYNTLGGQVAVLVDDYRQAGYYMVKFDGNGLSSGIYYYTIKVNDYTQTKKMLLVK